ncbi:MAG: hypothetical protein AB8H47_24700 [Bacteroidia bacterium]
MKKSLFLLPLLGTLLLIFSCKAEDFQSPQTEAIITGYDLALCACCGGLMITTTENPNKYEDEYYMLSNQSDFPNLDLTEFPISIKMDFEIDSTRCFMVNPWINVSNLEVID